MQLRNYQAIYLKLRNYQAYTCKWEIIRHIHTTETTNNQDRRCLKSFELYKTPDVHSKWLNNTTDGWNLVNDLLEYVMLTIHVKATTISSKTENKIK